MIISEIFVAINLRQNEATRIIKCNSNTIESEWYQTANNIISQLFFFKVNSKVKTTVITSNRFKTAFVKYLYFIHSMTEFTVTLTVKKH